MLYRKYSNWIAFSGTVHNKNLNVPFQIALNHNPLYKMNLNEILTCKKKQNVRDIHKKNTNNLHWFLQIYPNKNKSKKFNQSELILYVIFIIRHVIK